MSSDILLKHLEQEMSFDEFFMNIINQPEKYRDQLLKIRQGLKSQYKPPNL